MQWELKQRPDFAIGRIHFDQPGESIVLEASAMVARDPAVQMKTSMQGGLGSALKRKLMGGESLFQNTFTSTAPNQSVWFAPGADGDMECQILDGRMPVMMNSSAFVASAPSVNLDTKWGGAKGFFSGMSLFLVKADGSGPLFFGAYGGLHAVDVGPAGYIVDTAHIVAFQASLSYNVRGMGGLGGMLFGGEGLVCQFQGQGRLWLSTRNGRSLARFLHPYRRIQAKN